MGPLNAYVADPTSWPRAATGALSGAYSGRYDR